jgi:hypothetical protein
MPPSRLWTSLIAAGLLLGGAASAAAQVSLSGLTEKIVLKAKAGPSARQPGFEVAEYSGFSGVETGAVTVQLSWTGASAPVTSRCAPGSGPPAPAYGCVFTGAAPPDAAFSLNPALHAGALRWNGAVIRFGTREAGGYVFSRDGREIGGLDPGGGPVPAAFFLPARGSPDRDPVMVAALILALLPAGVR